MLVAINFLHEKQCSFVAFFFDSSLVVCLFLLNPPPPSKRKSNYKGENGALGRRYISLAKMKNQIFFYVMLVNRWQEEEETVDKWTEIVKGIVLTKDLTVL